MNCSCAWWCICWVCSVSLARAQSTVFFSLNFAMSSSSGAAQSSKAIGLIAEYFKEPENQAEAMAVWLKLSSGGFKETTVHLGSAGAGRFTPLYV